MRTRTALAAACLAALTVCASCASQTLLARPPGPPWQAPVDRQHALAGRIWDVADGRFLTPEQFMGRASQSRFLLLGEKHDNPDHHRLQAWTVRALVASGRRPAVAFEMFSPDQLPAIQRHLASHPQDAEGLAEVAGWEETGWPDFAMYQPVVEAALASGLEIHAANLSRAELESLRRHGMVELDRTFVVRFGLDQPLPRERYADFEEEIRKAHCGDVPQATLKAMIDVQRARDARMAQSLVGAAGGSGAVLIAGAGHARRKRGVPEYLILEESNVGISSVAFIEVKSGIEEPAEYVNETDGDGFDYLWFTPRVDDLDPCEKFRDQLEQLKRRHPPK